MEEISDQTDQINHSRLSLMSPKSPSADPECVSEDVDIEILQENVSENGAHEDQMYFRELFDAKVTIYFTDFLDFALIVCYLFCYRLVLSKNLNIFGKELCSTKSTNHIVTRESCISAAFLNVTSPIT
jgi:hypothetical protein